MHIFLVPIGEKWKIQLGDGEECGPLQVITSPGHRQGHKKWLTNHFSAGKRQEDVLWCTGTHMIMTGDTRKN